MPRTPLGPLDSLPCSSPSLLLSLSLRTSDPNASIAAAHCHRTHRPSLEHPPCPKDPPRCRRLPRQAKHRRTPRITVPSIVFKLQHQRSISSIRSNPAVPDLALALIGLAVVVPLGRRCFWQRDR
nr:uncharacterized protein LOC123494270 [Aegilops tauschii subsp. strangulata]